MKTRKTKKRNIIRRAVAFLLCMTMVLGLGMQDVIEQVYAEEASAVSREQSADVPATQEVESTETTTPEGETDPTASEETGPATPEEEPTAPEEDKKPADPANPVDTEENTDVTTPPAETTEPSAPEEPTTPADGTENTETDESTDLTAPVNPDGSNGSESSGETTTTPGEGTGTDEQKPPVEEETKEESVSELTYAAEDGSFSVKAAAVSEDVDLSGIEIHAAQVQKDGEEYAAAEELVAAALDAESRQIEELQAYDIWFTYTESGETADLSCQVQISLEYTAPEFPEGTDAQLDVFCLNGGTAEAVDGTDALAAGCELYALAWAVPAESTDTWEWTDGQVIIKASADKGVLPEGAEISVTPIVKTEEEELANLSEEERAEAEAINEQYAQTEEKLTEDLEVQAAEEAAALPAAEEVTADAEAADAASDSEETADASGAKTLEGFLAYDICFLVNGEEVEPADGEVNVSIEFSEAVIPEGVSEDAEVSVAHLKEEKNENGENEIVVEDLTAAETTIVETTEKAEVKKVEFTSDSFSTYVIKWDEDRRDYSLTIHIVDANGDSIGNETHELNVAYENALQSRDGLNLERYGANEWCPDGYYLTVARLDNLDGTDVGKVYCYDNIWRYSDETTKDNEKYIWSGDSNRRDVYLVYNREIDTELTTVDTVENLSDYGISMSIQDLDFADDAADNRVENALNALGGNYTGPVKQGLVQKKLSGGYPVTTNNTSLSGLFNDSGDVNNFFIKNILNTEGYFEYSSFDNYAYFNGKRFKIYNQIGAVSKYNNAGETEFYFHRGNFLPYNDLTNNKSLYLTNLYDEDGNKIARGNERFGQQLYLSDGVNYHFSMQMEATFLQPENGITKRGDEMIFEFNGDDDMWVYINDVLILDIGGEHDAHSGTINFATGDVTVNISADQQVTTSLNKLYKAANVFPDGTEWNDENITDYFVSTGERDANGDLIYRFKDYDRYTMKMFYMERGAGASNLHIKFNLETVPKGTVEVEKQVTNTNSEDYANEEFEFQIKVKERANDWAEDNPTYTNHYVVLTPALMEKEGITATLGQSGTALDMDEDGTFRLKSGQSAVFNNLEDTRQYIVSEIGVKSVEFDEVNIDGTTVKVVDEEGEVTDQGVTLETDELIVKTDAKVVFGNHCSAANSRELKVTKTMKEGQLSTDKFSFKIYLENQSGNLTPYKGGYYITQKAGSQSTYYKYDSATGELIQVADENDRVNYTDDGEVHGIPVGYTVSIVGIMSGTEFRVEEIDYDKDMYNEPVIRAEECGTGTIEGATGTIELSKDAQVTVENSYASVPDTAYLKVQKTFSGLTQDEINTLANNFVISVKNAKTKEWIVDLKLNDNSTAITGVEVDVSEPTINGNDITYVWTVSGVTESKYQISEAGEELENYTVETKVNNEVIANDSSVSKEVLIPEYNISLEELTVGEKVVNSTKTLNEVGLIVIELDDGFAVWTKEPLSLGERKGLASGISQIFGSEVKITYFSTEQIIREGFNYYGNISVNLIFSVKISIPLENTGVPSVFATSVWPFSLIFSLARRNEGNFFQAVPTTLSSSLAEVRLASLVAWA